MRYSIIKGAYEPAEPHHSLSFLTSQAFLTWFVVSLVWVIGQSAGNRYKDAAGQGPSSTTQEIQSAACGNWKHMIKDSQRARG